MKRLHIITDLQYGSCGKGLFAGYLALRVKPDTLITAWAPNAGHTFIDGMGNKMVNIALPNGIVSPSVERVLIGPGSVIDPDRLITEIQAYGNAYLKNVKLMIHENAAVVFESHREAEAKYGHVIGSTMKGVGEALCQKIRRKGGYLNVASRVFRGSPLEQYVVTRDQYNRAIDEAEVGVIEGAQGFSLSINQGFYPYTTSRDCTTAQLLSDCGVPLWMSFQSWIYGVCRTFPIRVSNREHSSGPGYPDQEEITWERVGVAPELTTVTKLPRRVFTFSRQQIIDAVRMNGVNQIFLNFCNYLSSDEDVEATITTINAEAPVKWTGWGPKITDIREIA